MTVSGSDTSVKLGVIVLFGFLAVLALRPYVQQRVVLPVAEANQPKRQFLMDLPLVVNLIVSYSRNLKLLFINQTNVLERVSRGDLSRTVPVVTRDEFGLIAGHTNSMIQGLRHRTKLITALKLAEEVQQNLLPATAPEHPGLELTGTSIYCDETGGGYYDFFKLPNQNLGVVVADASDHGIGAALLMTTARAFLISGISSYQGPARLAAEINQMFGLGRLRETVAQYSTASAAAIQTAVIERLNQYRGTADQEDDVTLVVVKLL